MTRTQKKCFFFSVGLHGLLAAVFVGTSGFREKPPQQDVLVMVNIPSDIRDVSDANAGGPGATPTPAPAQSAPPVPQPKVQPVVQPQPKPRPQPKLAVTPPPEPRPEPVERPRERETEEATARPTFTPKPVKVRPPRHHEVHVDYTPVTADDHRKLRPPKPNLAPKPGRKRVA
jgi:outer membrane biosynthesis protein TonB